MYIYRTLWYQKNIWKMTEQKLTLECMIIILDIIMLQSVCPNRHKIHSEMYVLVLNVHEKSDNLLLICNVNLILLLHRICVKLNGKSFHQWQQMHNLIPVVYTLTSGNKFVHPRFDEIWDKWRRDSEFWGSRTDMQNVCMVVWGIDGNT